MESAALPNRCLPAAMNPTDGLFPSRYESLDICRGIASLMVVFFHAAVHVLPTAPADVPWDDVPWYLWFLSRCFSGVSLFFVISGYCISASMDATYRKRKGVGEFARRRIRRIYPPFWASLALVFVVSTVAYRCGFPFPESRGIRCPPNLHPFEWFTNITLTHTWLPQLYGAYPGTLNGVSWTLCYEEQFYLACGLAIAVFGRRMFPFLLILSVVGMVRLGLFCADLPAGYRYTKGTFLDVQWLQFALGVLVYYRLVRAPRGLRLACDIVLCVLPVCTLIIIWQVPRFQSLGVSNPLFHLLVASIFAVVLRFLRSTEARLLSCLKKLRVLSPLHYLGRITYSLYLTHAMVVIFIATLLVNNGMGGVKEMLLIVLPVGTVMSLLLASAFYWVVERHCLNPASSSSGRNAVDNCVATVRLRAAPKELV